ncbi:hypothetical protein [Paraburkholderia azotifigens]|uniref:Uncharacterized protein n=1 Tax=Paraburkholderia azotifigens TaxID=2057004 RepID=A0ABU9RG86_9BURK
MRAEQFTPVEQESILLLAAWDMMSGMVNHSLFQNIKGGYDSLPMFKTSNDQRLFNILLGDFLSQPNERANNSSFFNFPKPTNRSRPTDYTFLFYLRKICRQPLLGRSSDAIQVPLMALSDWLESECLVEDVWFGSISVQADIRIPRIKYIKICGDIAKHNFSRLQSNVAKIQDTLKVAGKAVSSSDGFKALPDFYERFHDDVFTYHCAHIAEMLNNLLWGIYRYLLAEFEQSCTQTDDVAYRYEYPSGCNHEFARSAYWELMNCVRRKPYLPEFTVPQSARSHY